MNRTAIKDATEALGGELISKGKEEWFSGVSTDTRTISRGELFFALKGERFDGHEFLQQAVEKGAAGVVVERVPESLKIPPIPVIKVKDTLKALGDMAHWFRVKSQCYLIAITGSTGKTSTKEALVKLLEQMGPTHYTPGNLNNLVGMPLSLTGLGAQHLYCVAEMGMNRAGEIKRLTEIAEPDLGIITNIGPAHVEAFGGIQGIRRAKLELVENIRPYCPVLLDGDNKELLQEAKGFKRPILSFGSLPHNDFVLDIKEEGALGTFSIYSRITNEQFSFKVPIPVFQYLKNAAIATATAIYLRIDPELIQRGLQNLRSIKGRFQIIKLNSDIHVIDDSYNSNPVSLKQGIETMKKLFSPYRKILCIGDMLELGNMSEDAHIEAGKICSSCKPDRLFLIGEYSTIIKNSAIDNGLEADKVYVYNDKENLLEDIYKMVEPHTVFYFKASNRIGLSKLAEKLVNEINSKGNLI